MWDYAYSIPNIYPIETDIAKSLFSGIFKNEE